MGWLRPGIRPRDEGNHENHYLIGNKYAVIRKQCERKEKSYGNHLEKKKGGLIRPHYET